MPNRMSEDGQRPMRRLFKCLPMLPVNGKQDVDFHAADPALLVMLAEDAETTTRVIQQGVGAIGQALFKLRDVPLGVGRKCPFQKFHRFIPA